MTDFAYDDLQEFIHAAVQQRDEAAKKLAEYVRDHGDDPLAYQLADTILILDRRLKSLRRHLQLELS